MLICLSAHQKFLPSNVIWTGNLPPKKANNNNSSTIIRNDCIHTSQWLGTVSKSFVPVFEKGKHQDEGRGTITANAGRGGNLLKSAKNPFKERITNHAIHIVMITEAAKTIFCCLRLSQPLLLARSSRQARSGIHKLP